MPNKIPKDAVGQEERGNVKERFEMIKTRFVN